MVLLFHSAAFFAFVPFSKGGYFLRFHPFYEKLCLHKKSCNAIKKLPDY
jgi:hypothetical protein